MEEHSHCCFFVDTPRITLERECDQEFEDQYCIARIKEVRYYLQINPLSQPDSAVLE